MGFTLVAPLTLVVALAIVQLALTMHVRTVLVGAAAEGARAQARLGAPSNAGEQRARALIDRSLAHGLVTGISSHRERVGEIVLTTVQVSARVPWLGLLTPLSLEVDGHALEESP